MRATSWTGSENARRQEPAERKPSPYVEDAAKILPTTEAQFSVRAGTKVDIRCSGDDWHHHKTKQALNIYDHTIDGEFIVFRAYGWEVRVKRIAVALPRPKYRSRWKL